MTPIPNSRSANADLPGAWLSHIFNMADIDRNGLLNFPEFVAAPGRRKGAGDFDGNPPRLCRLYIPLKRLKGIPQTIGKP